jgi:hypothetical protein
MSNLDNVFERNRVTKLGIDAMITNYLRLEKELYTAQKDAERYRWLRERHENTIMDIYNSISHAMISPELLDAAIDAAMLGEK